MTRTSMERAPALSPAPVMLQRQCSTCGQDTAAGACGTCAEEQHKAEQGSEQDGSLSPQAAARKGVAPGIVHDVIQSPGAPLTGNERSFFGGRFGHDFSSVRVHSGPSAAQSARAVGAAAYTVGRHVVLGERNSNGAARQNVLAHELAHVVQQRSAAAPAGAPIPLGERGHRAEREADDAAEAALAGRQGNVSTTVPRMLQRQPAEKGGIPCQKDAYLVHTRTIDLQPIAFRSNAADKNPTGQSWSRRFAPSQKIWKKLAVKFNELAMITLTDAANKSKGANDAEANTIGALHSGAGIEVYMVDNAMAGSGGASTLSAGTASNIVMSDGGTSNTLLAHELAHVLGIGHPPGGGEAGTIAEPSGSRDVENAEKNTITNYNAMTYPADNVLTCIKPDT